MRSNRMRIEALIHSIVRKIKKLIDKKKEYNVKPFGLTEEQRKEILELLKQEKYKDGLSVTEMSTLTKSPKKGVNSLMIVLVNKGTVTRFKGINKNPKGGRHKEVYHYAWKGE